MFNTHGLASVYGSDVDLGISVLVIALDELNLIPTLGQLILHSVGAQHLFVGAIGVGRLLILDHVD